MIIQNGIKYLAEECINCDGHDRFYGCIWLDFCPDGIWQDKKAEYKYEDWKDRQEAKNERS